MKQGRPRDIKWSTDKLLAGLETIPALPIPYLRQPDAYSCGPTALAMILQYMGFNVTPDSLAERMNVQPDDGPFGGVQEEDLITVAESFQLQVHAQQGSTVADIVNFLRQRIPVMLGYLVTEPDGGVYGHFAVAIGTLPDALVIHDPWGEPSAALPVRYLEDHWTAESGKVDRWLMALRHR